MAEMDRVQPGQPRGSTQSNRQSRPEDPPRYQVAVRLDQRHREQSGQQDTVVGVERPVLRRSQIEVAGGVRGQRKITACDQSLTQSQGQEQQRDQQLNQRITRRDPRAAIAATTAQRQPTDERNVVVPPDWMQTLGTARTAASNTNTGRHAQRHHVDEASDAGTHRKQPDCQEHQHDVGQNQVQVDSGRHEWHLHVIPGAVSWTARLTLFSWLYPSPGIKSLTGTWPGGHLARPGRPHDG